MYFVFAAAGIVFATAVFVFLLKSRRFVLKLPLFIGAASGVGLLCGARLFGYAATYIYYIDSGEYIPPGLVFYGGLIGFLAVFVFSQMVALGDISPVMCDCAAVFIPAFHFFGRIGCYLASCCSGEISGIPVQLVESGFNLVLFFIFIILYVKQKCGGKLLYLYLLCYSLFRFFAEFFRTDIQRGIIGILSFSQWISIVITATVIVTAVIFGKRK